MVEIITGYEGFLGKHLTKLLESKDLEVRGLDWRDLSDPSKLEKFFKNIGECHIYHLAAYGNLHGQDELKEIFSVVDKLINLLQATDEVNCKGMVVMGSSSEYGVGDRSFDEDTVCEPVSFYGAAKTAQTLLAQVWGKERSFPVVVARPSSLIGTGDHAIHFVPWLIRSCIQQEPMEFAGEPMRDYIDVDDLSKAIYILARNANDHKGEIFNVASGIQRTGYELLNLVEELTGKKANIGTFLDKSFFDKSGIRGLANQMDITKMRSLGWKPETPIRVTVQRMIDEIS